MIFWVATCTSTIALLLTLVLTPVYNGATLDKAEALAESGDTGPAAEMLYSGPQVHEKGDTDEDDATTEQADRVERALSE